MIRYRVRKVGSKNYLGQYDAMNEAGWFCNDMDRLSRKHKTGDTHEIVEFIDRTINTGEIFSLNLTAVELGRLINWGETLNSDDTYRLSPTETGLIRALKEKLNI